jgi:ectoine hydroxylase-related dioxygenase (phytanoyl-CoA dioxygenase family)
MLDQDVSSYGVLEAPDPGDQTDVEVEELTRIGYTVVHSGISAARLDTMRERLAAVYARQAAELDASLDASNDADVARCLLAYDDCFFELATNAALLEFSTRLFGDSFVLLQQNGVINRPSREHYQLRWHRDLPFQHWVTSKPVAFAALFCLDDFNATTGGTYALPGSHRDEAFPSAAFVRRHQQVMTAPAGTFIVMDAMMYHRTGKNHSANVRRGINHLIGRPFLAQQIDIPRMLKGAHAGDPFLGRYLGYKWNPAASIEDWRHSRIANT